MPTTHAPPPPGPAGRVDTAASGHRPGLAGPLTAAGIAAASVGWIARVDPNVPGRYPVCPSVTLFGVLCPLCGGLRGVHALTQGDVVGMVSDNVLLPVLVVVALWGWLAWVGRLVSLPVPTLPRPGPRSWWLVSGLLVAWTVARNLPGLEVLAP